MNFKRFSSPLLLISCLLVFSACNKKEGCTDPAALNYDPDAEKDMGCEYVVTHATEMHFHSLVNGVGHIEGDTYMIDGVKTELDFTRFYVSNMRLVDSAGNETPTPVKYLYVQNDPDEYQVGEIPDGNYAKVRFEIGIDSATNHGDPSLYAIGDPLGAQFPNMHWGWSLGYIFVRIDGVADSDGDGAVDDGFEIHLGTEDYLATIEIDYPITIGDGQENIFHLYAHWEKLFEGVDLSNTANNTTHTTDNFPLANIVFANLQNFITPE